MPTAQTVKITAMGARGEGVVELSGKKHYVPLTLPGEEVTARFEGTRGKLDEVLAPSDQRTAPSCPHFGRCGGCQLQHWQKPTYQAWKRKLVVDALARFGLMVKVGPLVEATESGRRRVTLHARNGRAGYMGLRSHFVHPIDQCPILAPELAPATDIARACAGLFTECDIAVTAARNGLDVALFAKLKKKQKIPFPALSEIAQRFDLARMTINDELVLMLRQPEIAMGKAIVPLPPGTFLQATASAEDLLSKLTVTPLKGAARIADLFSGLGPFALRLAEHGKVFAVDSNRAAVAACETALRATPGLKIIGTARRDLVRDPLTAKELEEFDAVVLDPPRAGAEAQAEELALSSVPQIVSISCDPQSFARDANILVSGGYKLVSVIPVDQFLWSAHVEIVGLFQHRSFKRT